jgi:hypothetical protein
MEAEQARGVDLNEIRKAFALGDALRGEELMHAALDAGLGWDVETRVVAEGYAARFSSGSQSVDGSLAQA